MIDIFIENDYASAKKEVKNLIIYYSIALFLFLAISGGLLFWFTTLPYKSPTIVWVKIIQYTLAVVFVVGSFVFFGVKFKRVNRYRKLSNHLLNGIREQSEAEFLENDYRLFDKDGVDCHAMIFLEWNKYKKEYFERKVLILAEKTFPEIPEKSRVRFITQGNVIVSYEIIEDTQNRE